MGGGQLRRLNVSWVPQSPEDSASVYRQSVVQFVPCCRVGVDCAPRTVPCSPKAFRVTAGLKKTLPYKGPIVLPE